MSDLISRQAAINALWKALYEYEDKTEKQFIESDELDVADWFQHRIFVQNMSDVDRQTLLDLPSADTDLSDYSDRLWKNAYERGKAEGARIPSAQPDFSCDGCQTPKHICGICRRNYPNITDHYCTGEAEE